MKAQIKELRRVLFDFDFQLLVNKETYGNSKARKLLYDLKDQDLEVNFYIGSIGIIVIEDTL